jgi:putative copper export protein/methionine-rich copper-binding protein CopC
MHCEEGTGRTPGPKKSRERTRTVTLEGTAWSRSINPETALVPRLEDIAPWAAKRIPSHREPGAAPGRNRSGGALSACLPSMKGPFQELLFVPPTLLLAALLVLAAPAVAPAMTLPGPADAAAHTELLESRPGAEAALSSGEVEEILLRFSTPVQLHLSRIRVVDDQGVEVAAGELFHPNGAADRLVLPFPAPLPPGRYTVEWRAGAPDNHLILDSFSFQVEGTQEPPGPEAAAPPTPPATRAPGASPPPPATTPLLPSGTGARWLHLLGMVLLLGVTAFRFGVVRPLQDREEMAAAVTAMDPGLRRLGWLSALLLVVALPLRLWGQVGTGGSELAMALLFRSAWGAGWFFQLAAAGLALVGLVLLRGEESRPRGWGILAGAALLVPLVPALSGHAWGADARAIAVPALYLHVAAVGTWLGGLLVLVAIGLPAVSKARRHSAPSAPSNPSTASTASAAGGGSVLPPLALLVNAFSRMAVVAVAVMVVSGSLSAFLQLGGLGALFTTAYGRTLGLKLGLVAGALLLGFYNWRKVRPSLEERPDPGELRIPASMETVLGLLVLLVTAVLVATPPP